MTETNPPAAPSLEFLPYPQQAPDACRSTRHCADHGWCHRCAPEFAAVMSRVNAAIQGTDVSPTFWGPLYAAVGQALRVAATVPASAPTDRSRWQRYADAMDAVTGGTCPADLVQAVIAVADAEQAGLRTAFNNQLDLFANEYDRHREEERRLRDAAEQHRLALSQALGLGTGAPWNAIRERAAELAAPADRAAILREAASAVAADTGFHIRYGAAIDYANHYAALLRGLADAASGPGRADDKPQQDETQARRGDAFEAWLKAQRDQHDSDGTGDHEMYDALDSLLDEYRLHADTGTPLREHVCEGRTVGDCECLEQAAAVSQPGKEA